MTDPTTPRDSSVPPSPPTDPAAPAAPTDATPQEPKPKKRPHWGRRLLIAAAVIILLLILLAALVPTLISTGPGNRLAANIAERFIDGDVTIDGLSVGWTSGTSVDSLVIDDPQTSRVLDVANFRSGLSLLQAIRGDFDLGQTTFRAQLPLITVDPEGKTNLDRVFRLDEPSEPTDFDPASLRGSVKGDVLATIQRVDAQGDPDGPRIDVDLSGFEATFADGKSVRHSIPVRLEVAGEPAGSISADGEVTLPTEDMAIPPVSEKLTISDVDLEAIEMVMAAFGKSDLDLAGLLNGEFDIDTGAGTLAGSLAGEGVNIQPQGGTGYAADTLELTLQGSFQLPEEGAETTAPEFATIETLRVVATSDQGQDELDFSGVVNLAALQDAPLANWPTLAQNVELALNTSFASAQGSGASLGAFQLTGNADMAALRERFGELIPAEALAGRVDFNFSTSPGATEAESVVARWTVNGRQLQYLPAEPEAVAERESERVSQPAPDAAVAGDRVSQPPPNREATAEAERRPASFETMTLEGSAVLARGSADRTQGIPEASMNLLLANAGETLLTGALSATDLDAKGTVGEIRLDLVIPDYSGLRTALGSVAELPEPTGEGEVPPLRVTAAVDLDEETKTVRLSEPLVVTADGQTLATVELAAREVESNEESSTWEAQRLSANVSLAVADLVLSPLGLSPSKSERMSGEIVVGLAPGQPLRVNSSDPAGSASGRIETRVAEAQMAGFNINGVLPVELSSGVATVPADAEPLQANGGFIRLAGASLDLAQNYLTPPEGDVIDGVGLNPVISDVLGQFINPVFVNPEQANGFFNLQVASAGPLNLSDPFGAEGGDVTITFGIRELFIKNDIIGALAEAGLEKVSGALPGSLTQLPGVGQSLRQNFDISEEVQEEISSFRGNLADGRVRLVNGVAESQVTFNIADPRAGEGAPGELYGVTFAGDINLATLAADLGVTLPRSLIEKWAGENPEELVKIFGEQPFQKLIPEGVTLGINGTSRIPTVDVSDLTENVMPRAVDAAIKGGVQQRLEDELKKRIPGLFQ